MDSVWVCVCLCSPTCPAGGSYVICIPVLWDSWIINYQIYIYIHVYDCMVSITELILLNCDASHFIFYYTVCSASFKEVWIWWRIHGCVIRVTVEQSGCALLIDGCWRGKEKTKWHTAQFIIFYIKTVIKTEINISFIFKFTL